VSSAILLEPASFDIGVIDCGAPAFRAAFCIASLTSLSPNRSQHLILSGAQPARRVPGFGDQLAVRDSSVSHCHRPPLLLR